MIELGGLGVMGVGLSSAELVAVDPASFGAVGDVLRLVFGGPLDASAELGSTAVSFATAPGISCSSRAVRCTVAGDTLTVEAVRSFSIRRDLGSESVAGIANLTDADGQSAVVPTPIMISTN